MNAIEKKSLKYQLRKPLKIIQFNFDRTMCIIFLKSIKILVMQFRKQQFMKY